MSGPKNAAFAEESAEVEVLLASLTKTKDLTKRIASSMSRLDASGQIVRDAIGPIYSNTQQLQVISRNIDRVNEAIERIRQPLDARGQEEGIIRAGPKNAGLQQYLGALKKVDRAVTDLSSSNLRSNQVAISEFHGLLSTGANQLNELYRQMLQEDVQQVEPLHYITKELAFPTIPAEKLTYLSQIAGAIAAAGAQSARLGQKDDDMAAKMYADIRGEYLQNSLQNLATGSINTAKRQRTGTEIYRQGSSGIGTYVQGMEGMFLAEHENTSNIFRGESSRILTMTCSKALGTFSRTLAELNTIIKSRILTDCFLAYEILDLITPLSYRLNSRTNALRPQLSEALRPIRDTARSSLTELLNQTKQQAESVSTLPSDGNTVPLVSQTAQRLQSLATYDQSILLLLSSLGDGNWGARAPLKQPSSLSLELTPSTENPTLLSHYLLDLLDALITSLTNRSQTLHRTKPLQSIFLMNTVAVLERAIHSTSDLSRYLAISPHNARLEIHRKSATSSYLAGWRDSSSNLADTIAASKSSSTSGRPVSGQQGADSASVIKSLSSKDKDKVKEKFKLFNSSFDELVARHKSLHMEKEVKGPIGKEIQNIIEPPYVRFWERYHEVDKGKGKVVKYSKSDLVNVLRSL